MIQFISKELNYPASPAHDSLSNGSYKVFVRFVVDTSGRVVEPTVVKAFPECPECEKKALRVMRKMPVWRPGMQQGKKVNVTFTIPITFTSH